MPCFMIRVRPATNSTDNPVRHRRTIDNAIVLSRDPCTVWIRHRPVQFDIRLVSLSFDSCHSCLLRYCTFSYATRRQPEIRKLPLGSVMPTDGSVAELCRTLLRRLYLPFSFMSSRRIVAMAPTFPSSTMSNSIDSRGLPFTLARPYRNGACVSKFNNVELHRPTRPCNGVSKFNNVELHRQSNTVSICISVACQQCRTPSTNCTKSSPVELHQHSVRESLPVNNVELHRRVVMVPPFNNVELHRQP